MNTEQAISHISSLPASEQIQVINAIWDGLPEDVSDLMPTSEKAIPKERLAEYNAKPSNLVSEAELSAELNKRKQT